jgi:hypothetical protein
VIRASLPVIALTAEVSAPAVAAMALASVKYLFVPSSMSEVERASTAVVIAVLRADTSVVISPSA